MIKLMKFNEDQSERCDSFIVSLFDTDSDNYFGIKKAIISYIQKLEENYNSEFEFAFVTEIDLESDNLNFSVDIEKAYFDNLFDYTFNLIKNIKKKSAYKLDYRLLVEQKDEITIFASVHPKVYALYLDQKNNGHKAMSYHHYSSYEDLYNDSDDNFDASEFEPYKAIIRYNS